MKCSIAPGREGPQRIQRRQESFVVIPEREYEQLTGKRRSFTEFLLDGLRTDGLEPMPREQRADAGSAVVRVLFDTSVISEVTRTSPDLRVTNCVQSVPPDDAFLSVITIGELFYGIPRLPPGKKRSTPLQAWLNELEQTYAHRLLSIDTETTRVWGEITAARDARGRPPAPPGRPDRRDRHPARPAPSHAERRRLRIHGRAAGGSRGAGARACSAIH